MCTPRLLQDDFDSLAILLCGEHMEPTACHRQGRERAGADAAVQACTLRQLFTVSMHVILLCATGGRVAAAGHHGWRGRRSLQQT